jgi:hypothetical protein
MGDDGSMLMEIIPPPRPIDNQGKHGRRPGVIVLGAQLVMFNMMILGCHIDPGDPGEGADGGVYLARVRRERLPVLSRQPQRVQHHRYLGHSSRRGQRAHREGDLQRADRPDSIHHGRAEHGTLEGRIRPRLAATARRADHRLPELQHGRQRHARRDHRERGLRVRRLRRRHPHARAYLPHPVQRLGHAHVGGRAGRVCPLGRPRPRDGRGVRRSGGGSCSTHRAASRRIPTTTSISRCGGSMASPSGMGW